MKVSKRKKNMRVTMFKPVRIALSPVCPNCGCHGAHFSPPIKWQIAPGMVWEEPGEFLCQKGVPMIDAEIIEHNH